MNDDRIKELLDSAAPDQPDLPVAARTTAVRDRATAVRRRNRLVLVAAVVAVVGVGVGVPVLTSGDDPSGTQQQVANDPTDAPPAEPPACPDEPIDVTDGVAAETLPDGAVSARACPATWSGGATSGGADAQTLPAEPLVGEDVAAFVRDVRNLGPYAIDDDCALMQVAPVPWAIVVSYPDGTSQTIGTTSQVCSSVRIETSDHGSDEVIEVFTDLAGEKSGGSLGVGDTFSATCPTDQTGVDEALDTLNSYEGDLADFAPDFALACYLPGDDTEPAYTNEDGLVSPDDVVALGEDLAAGFTSTPQRAGRCTENGGRRVLVLNDGDNATVTLVDNSCTGEFSGHGVYWIASPGSEAVLDNALNGTYFD